jgi:hypothetical protein
LFFFNLRNPRTPLPSLADKNMMKAVEKQSQKFFILPKNLWQPFSGKYVLMLGIQKLKSTTLTKSDFPSRS